MIFFFILSFGKSNLPNYDYNLSLSSNYFLYLKEDGIDIRNSSLTSSSSNIHYSNSNVVNGTLYLNLGVFTNSEFKLFLATEEINPCNLKLYIENLDASMKNLQISFYSSSWTSVNNLVNITFNAERDFLYLSNIDTISNNVNLKIFTLNENQLIANFPLGNKEKYIICYQHFDCSSKEDFLLQPDELYLSSIDDNNLQNVVSNLISSSKLQFIRFLFNEQSEEISFPVIPMGQIQQLELYGYSSRSQKKIRLTKEIENQTLLVSCWIINNVQFSTESPTSHFYFQKVIVNNTDNVFPEQGTFFVDIAYEYRFNNTDILPFQYVEEINQAIFEINTEFNRFDNIQLSVSDHILVSGIEKNSSPAQLTTLPFYSAVITCIFIQHQENAKSSKITIEPLNALRPFRMVIENCDPIHIEFTNWNQSSYSDFTFEFLTSKPDDITITRTNSDFLRYLHRNRDGTRLFSEYPISQRNIVFCLYSDECDQPDFYDREFVQLPISGENLTDVTLSFHKKLEELKTIDFIQFVLILNKECNNIELDLGRYLTGSHLKTFRIICEDDLINVQMKSLPSVQDIFWEINKCHISADLSENETYLIQELLSVDDGRFDNEKVIIANVNYIENIDLTTSDQTIIISDNQIEYLNTIAKKSDTIKFIIKPSSSNKIIFEPKIFTCMEDVNIDFQSFDENNLNIAVAASDKWSQVGSDQIGIIKINVENSEHIVFKSIIEKACFKVYNKEATPRLLEQIPKYSTKINICYGNDKCTSQSSFTISDDVTLLSMKSDEEFIQLMNLIKSNSEKIYSEFTLSFVRENEDFVVKFQEIPTDQIDILNLNGFGSLSPYILLTEETETEGVKKWFIDKVRFHIPSEITKIFTFHTITVNDTSSVFPTADNFNFGIAHSIIKPNYDTTAFQIVKNRIGTFMYDIFPEFENSDYSIQYNSSNILLNGTYISDPPLENFSFYVHSAKNQDNHKIIISRENSPTFKTVNLIFDSFEDQISIEYICDSTCENELFVYNFYFLEGTQISHNQGSCLNVKTNEINYHLRPTNSPQPSPSETPTKSATESVQPTPSPLIELTSSSAFSPSKIFTFSNTLKTPPPTKTFSPSGSFKETPSGSEIITLNETIETIAPEQPSELPVVTISSNSTSFELTANGFVDDFNQTVSKTDQSINVVSFQQQQISITESSEYESQTPLYFKAEKENSVITFSENVSNSNVGVLSDNSPTVQLSKSENPVSFMNNISVGKIDIDLPETVVDNFLNFKEVNNRQGSFSLGVPRTINLVSFASITMSQISSFAVNSRANSQRRINDEIEDDRITVEVRDLVDITSLSDATLLSNIEISGNLRVCDDSSLKLTKNVTFSEVEIVFKTINKNREKAVISIGLEEPFISIPTKITVSSQLNDGLIDVSNFPLIEAKNFSCCEDWRKKVEFQNGREGDIESSCEEIQNDSDEDINTTVLYLSVKERAPKADELTPGVIAAIAVACVAAVALIILLVVFLFKLDHPPDVSTDITTQEDSIGL